MFLTRNRDDARVSAHPDMILILFIHPDIPSLQICVGDPNRGTSSQGARVVTFSLCCVVAFSLITFSSVFLKLLFKLIYWSTCQAFLLNPLQSVLFKCGILVKNWINIMLDCSCSFSFFAPVSFIDCTWRPTYFLSSENKRQQIRLVTCRPSEWFPVTFNQNSTPFDILLSASRLIHRHWPSVVWFTWVVYTTKFTQFYLQFSFFGLVLIFQPTDGWLTRYDVSVPVPPLPNRPPPSSHKRAPPRV